MLHLNQDEILLSEIASQLVKPLQEFKSIHENDADAFISGCVDEVKYGRYLVSDSSIKLIKLFISHLPDESKKNQIQFTNSVFPKLRSILVNNVNTSEYQQAIMQLIGFLDSDEEKLFYKQMSKVCIVMELLAHLLKPQSLDQGITFLCGIASTMSLLLHANPSLFVAICLQLAKDGTAPILEIKPSSDSIQQDKEIVFALLSAIKNNYTILQYSSKGALSSIMGLTRPIEITKILQLLNCDTIQDLIDLNKTSLNKIAVGVVSDASLKQQFVKIEDNLEALSNAFSYSSPAILLLSSNVMDILSGANETKSFFEKYFKPDIPHYVYLKRLYIDKKNGTIDLTIETWGKSYEKKALPLSTFLKGYLGAIVCSIDKLRDINPLLLQKKIVDDKNEEKSASNLASLNQNK